MRPVRPRRGLRVEGGEGQLFTEVVAGGTGAPSGRRQHHPESMKALATVVKIMGSPLSPARADDRSKRFPL
jgi:hypothetical protein